MELWDRVVPALRHRVRTIFRREDGARAGVDPHSALPDWLADSATNAAALCDFVQSADSDLQLSERDFRALARGADEAYLAKCYAESDIIYTFLLDHDHGGYFARLRRADLAWLCGDPDEALRKLDLLSTEREYDFHAETVRAMALRAAGRLEESVRCLRGVVEAAPGRTESVRLLIGAFERTDDKQALRDVERYFVGLPPDVALEFRFRAAAYSGDSAKLIETLTSQPDLSRRLHPDVVAHAMRVLDDNGRRDVSLQIADALDASHSTSPKIIAALLHHFTLEEDWDEADALLKHHTDMITASQEPKLFLAAMAYLISVQRYDEARTLLTTWGDSSKLPTESTGAMVRVLGVLKEWDLLIDLILERVDRGDTVAEIALEGKLDLAARHTGRYEEILVHLDAASPAQLSPGAVSCRNNIAFEVAFLREIGARDDGPVASDLDPDVAERLSWWRMLFSTQKRLVMGMPPPPAGPVHDAGIFFCTDLNYLIGTCVAVHACLRHNPDLRTAWPITVVCAPDAYDLAERMLGAISEHTGRQIRMLNASELPRPSGSLRTSWGAVSTDEGLSEAAYFRVFTAKWLIERGDTGRALYIDSDTVPGPGLERLLTLDLEGQPLGARTEDQTTSIGQAAAKLGIETSAYFNSGVLLFDLSHHELSGALETTLDFAHRHPELLTFVDQCALNVGFLGLRATAPIEFNTFIRAVDDPIGPPVGSDPEPVIRHYLQAPKPWDPLYPYNNRALWLLEVAALARALPPQDLKSLLAQPFRSRTRTPP